MADLQLIARAMLSERATLICEMAHVFTAMRRCGWRAEKVFQFAFSARESPVEDVFKAMWLSGFDMAELPPAAQACNCPSEQIQAAATDLRKTNRFDLLGSCPIEDVVVMAIFVALLEDNREVAR